MNKRFIALSVMLVVTLLYIAPVLSTATDTTEVTWQAVPYTEQEKELIVKMKIYHDIAYDILVEGGEESDWWIFDVAPDLEQNPIVPGIMNVKIAQGTTLYLNLIRMGLGLSEVEWSPELTEAAQCKATLVTYIHALDERSGHYPAKPEGFPQELYDKAQSYMGDENLYMAGIGTISLLYSIDYAIDDVFGDTIATGHRYNLLDPYATKFGAGIVGGQAVHKLIKGGSSDIKVVAWPSGIVRPDSDTAGFFSVKFYNKSYKTTPETTVKVTLLNTGEVWKFVQDESVDGHYYYIVSDTQLSFYDDTLEDSKQEFNVYEVTVDNLEGENTSYTYRIVYIYVEDIDPENFLESTESEEKSEPEEVEAEEFEPEEGETEVAETEEGEAEENVVAVASSQKVLVNGDEVAFEAYNIEGYNYFKLRDLAYTLNGTKKQFEVGWDAENNAISLTSGEPYTVVGGEMTGKGDGDKTPVPTTAKIFLDGEEVQFEAYNIDGNNYFKLRDVMRAFDVFVGYDETAKTITIDTSGGYTE